ncbi:MAG: hypothetical protein IT450_04820 [Phycisphaerales bacterium]|nr:hypothetical protein [Phycisphaerales bacterium]
MNTGTGDLMVRLIDVEWAPAPVPAFRLAVVIGALAILAPVCLLVVGSAYVAIQMFGWPAGVVIALLSIAAIHLFRVFSDRCASSEAAATREALESAGADLGKIIEAALHRSSSTDHHAIGVLCEHLAAAGHRGLVVRIGRSDSFVEIYAIDVPFEPIPIDEFDPRFVQIASPDGPAPPRAMVERLLNQEGQPEKLLRIREWLARNYWLAIALCAFAGYELIRTGLTGTWSVSSVGLIVSAVCIGAGTLGDRNRRTSRLLLVPGGILARRPFRGGFSDVTLFSRSDSVLLTLQNARDSFGWWCADSQGNSCTSSSSRAETEMLLRTWFSPIQPPRIEQLADFR